MAPPHSIVVPSFLLTSLSLALAGGTVTNLTQADLEAALQGGGTVTFAVNGRLTLTNSITITDDTTLDANSNAVVISGGNAVQLFQIATNVQFWIKGLVVADGSVVGTNGPASDPTQPGGDASGAGILNRGGSLILTDCTLTNHSVQGGNASSLPFPYPGSGNSGNGGKGLGPAICSFGGSVNLTNCTISSCTAAGGMASINGTAASYSGGGWGGAIYAEQTKINLVNVSLRNNQATGGGTGEMFSYAICGDGSGGALFASNSVVLIAGCTLLNNAAAGSGSYLLYSPPGDGLGGALFLAQDCSAQIQLCQFSSNTATGGNGYHFSGCGFGRGGSVYNGGSLQVWQCSFLSNQCTGGSYAYTGGTGQGGAIFSTNVLAVGASSFVGNFATGGQGNYGVGTGATQGNAEGGALWIAGVLNATNSTFTGGGAVAVGPGESSGGGIMVTNGRVFLVNLTVASNGAFATNSYQTGPNGPMLGGDLSSSNASVAVLNSIIANNASGGDVWGVIIDGGYNICSDGTAGFSSEGSLNQADPMLSALSQNGGPTPTMSLLVGSPARDAIPSGFPPVDQRGVSRPQGPAADIGAVEADFVSSTPAIVTQPLGGTVRAGTNVTLTVGASGTAPLIYQWLKDGTALAGATESSLSLSNVQAADAGTYWAVVTNVYGSATSQGAVLVVDSRPVLLAPPTSVVISPGGTAQFSVSADGPALSYQWWHDSVGISGATSSALAISNAMAGAQGNYFVVVTNFAGSITSAPAILTFDSSALSILVPPKDQIVEAGYPASFSVLVSGIPPFAYQWQHNGTAIPGATTSALALLGVSTNDAGSYNVAVTNGYSSVVSVSAQLTVTAGAVPPALVVQRFGQNLTITFNAQGGRSYRLLESTNFLSWYARETNSAISSGPLQFVQPIQPIPGDFFRVVTP